MKLCSMSTIIKNIQIALKEISIIGIGSQSLMTNMYVHKNPYFSEYYQHFYT